MSSPDYGKTSLITILSCEHGRLRREQRDINKRDLQRALKFGSRDRAWKGRWKVEYEGVIFITDETCRKEVTAYPAPLSLVGLVLADRVAHDKAKLVTSMKPELCASHTVLVVDNSGSMTTHDIPLHRDRQIAAYTTAALEFIAEQLLTGTANNSDVVSLIEFSGKAQVVFTREPVSWVLFNKLLSRRDISRTFAAGEAARSLDVLYGDSNYLPPLDAAEKLLAGGTHDSCALSLFFLSDGAPSDARQLGLTPAATVQRMCTRTTEIATRFAGRLNILMVGFGNEHQDFSALESMVKAANEATGKETASFMYCAKMANAIGAAITTLVSTSVATRMSLKALKTSGGKTLRRLESEAESGISNDWRYYRIMNHRVYDPKMDNWVWRRGLPPGAWRADNIEDVAARARSPPPLLALNRKHCGSGVERVAFRCHLSDGKRTSDFRFGAMVAKETKTVERIEENIAFHKTFCMTQDLAAHLADEFNKRIPSIPCYDKKATPRIKFLECSILVLEDFEWPGTERGVLVEKMLDTDRYGWCKWNNNAGAVDGKVAHVPIDVDLELAKIEDGDLDVIAEGDSDEESEDGSEDSDSPPEGILLDTLFSGSSPPTVNPSEYLQAFTHFSYLFTNKQVMVCDLQGVLNTDAVPPTFELSDPAIHYASKAGREMVFGRTDLGKGGMDAFFKTHKCSGICKYMNLSKKNKEWKKHWRNGQKGSGVSR